MSTTLCWAISNAGVVVVGVAGVVCLLRGVLF